MKNKILVTGGAGYLGCVLVKKLLELGHFVRVLDVFMYMERDKFRELGDMGLPGKLDIFRGDIRDERLYPFTLEDVDTVIHLACISNDPSFDLDPKLGKSVNLDCFEPFVRACKLAGVKRFINASSSSVYGVNDSPEITETTFCNPLTDYSRFKFLNERALELHEGPEFATVSVRSATICGYSPRQRLDVIVNILTNHAYNLGKITVTGGPQKRPNVHIEDIADLYVKLVHADVNLVTGQIFNYGGPNYTVDEIAALVKRTVTVKKEIRVIHKETNDPRSYHISSDKAFSVLGMRPKRTIEQAVLDLCTAFSLGNLPNSLTDSKYFNIEKMKEIKCR